MKISEIPLFLDTAAIRASGREPSYTSWNFVRCPHLLVMGATGSGKTYAVKLLLGRISKYLLDAEITLCDYKHDDFRFLDGYSRYFEFERCAEGLNQFYTAFQMRQQGDDSSRSFRLLLFDEWASFISMMEKKEAEDAKRKLSTLLMLGRSFNCHVLVSQQRADAAYFSSARDNFSVIIALGNLSKESRDMFFSSFKDQLEPVSQIGAGHMLVNGVDLYHIQVPKVANEQKLKESIQQLVT